MADLANLLEKYKELLFDRAKYFKSEYETLPIPDLDISYFQKLNTADLMEYNPILGAIFIPYKHDIYILEQDNIGKFFIREEGKENKVMKRISALNSNESEISTIKLSKCLHMLAVIVGKEIRIYLVKNMFTEGKAVLVDTFVGEKVWRTLQWSPRKSETSDDVILAIDEDKKLHTFNLKTKEKKSHGDPDHSVACATFSSDGDHIFAVTTRSDFIVFKAPALEVKTTETIKFIELDDMYAKTILSHIQEIKKDLWLFSGAVDDDDGAPIRCSKHTYMVEGDLANKNINSLPAQLFNEMFLPVYGVDQPNFQPAYYKHVYVPQRDVIVSGCTLAAEVTAIINKNPKGSSTDINRYEGFEMGVEQNIKLAAPAGVTGFFRGMVLYRNKFGQSDKFDYNENDEEKSMAYPPFIFVLSSTGQIAKYAFLLMKPEYQEESLLIKTEGLAGLKRNIPINTGSQPAATKPTITQSQGFPTQQGSAPFQAPLKKPDFLSQSAGAGTGLGTGLGIDSNLLSKQNPVLNNQPILQPATTTTAVAAKPTISEVVPANIPAPADEPWGDTDFANVLEKHKELLFDRAKYFKSEYETLPIPNLDMKYFQNLNTADLMEHNPILGAIFIPYKQDIYILEQENVGKFFLREDGKENKIMKCIKALAPTDPEISMIKLSKCFNMLAVIVGKEIRVYLVKNMFTEGKAALVECWTGDKNWKTLQWAPRKSELSDDMLLAIDEDNKLTSFNFKTKEGKRYGGGDTISCATFSSDAEHIFAVTTKNEFIIFKSSTLQVVKIEFMRFVAEDSFDITVFTKLQEVKKDLWLISGAVDDDRINPIQCSKHTFMIQGDILNKKINELPVQLFNEMFLPVYGVDQPKFEPAFYKHLYIPQRDVIVSGCTLCAEVTAIINKNPKSSSPDINRYEGFEMGVEQNIKLAAPAGVTGFFRGMIFYNNKFTQSDTFDYNENDEEKSMAYPPFIFVLSSTGQIAKYAFLLMKPEYQEESLLIKTEGLAGLKRNIPLSASLQPAAKPILAQSLTTPTQQGSAPFQAPLKKPDLIPQPTGPGTGLNLLSKQNPIPNDQSKPTTGLGFDIKPALDTKPQQPTNEGTFDPIAANINNIKSNIMKKIDGLTSYTDLINDVKKIFPKLSQKDKEFYQKEIQVQKTLYECQTFFKSLGLLLVEQEASRKKLEALIKSVDTESDAIRCIIGDEIIEGKEMNIYQNSELRQQVRKCEGQLKFFDEKLDYIEDFLDNYSTIIEERPTAAPEVIIGSPIKQLEERSNTIYHSFKNDDENSTSLYLTPMSSILRMSRSSKAPPAMSTSSKLQKSTMNNNISLTTSIMVNKSQAQKSAAAAAVPQTNVSGKSSYIRAAPSLRATQLDTEYTRQLNQLNSKFNEALDHTQHKLHEIRRELQVLNRNIDRSAVKKQDHSPPKKLTESTATKTKRGIFFNPDSDSDEESNKTPSAVFTQQGLFDQILGQSKAAKTTTVKIPLHKHKQVGYNGPQLKAILSNFDDLLAGKKALSSLPKVSVPQPVQNKTAAATVPGTTTEKKPLTGGLITQPQAPKVQAPSSIQQTAGTDGLKNKETGLFNFTTKPAAAQEEDKKPLIVPGSQTGTTSKPLFAPKEEAKTGEKPAAVTGGLFATGLKTQPAQPEEKKVDAKPEASTAKPGGLFAGASTLGGSKTAVAAPTEKKEITDSSSLKIGPVPEDRKIKTLIKPGSQQLQQKPQAPLKLKDAGEESGYKDEDEDGEKDSESSGTDLTEEEKDQVTPPPMKKSDMKPIKSIIGNLSDLDKMVTKSQAPGGKAGQKQLLESVLNNDDDNIPNIPAPVLVRDDSYVQPKSLEGPKVDFFKTMTGKPPFLQKSEKDKPQESREEIAAKLKESLPKPGENITLFTKKITKEESKEPETLKKSEPEIKAPEVSQSQPKEALDLDAGFLDDAELFGSPILPTNTEQNQPEPPAVQENKPAPQTVNTNLFNKPVTTAPATNPTFTGLNITGTSGPTLFNSNPSSGTGTKPMFPNPPANQTSINFGQQQQSNPGANRFAIGGGNTQQPTAPTNPMGVGQAGFGTRQLPSFGNTGQPTTTNFGQHGGVTFGQHGQGGFGQQQLQKPIVQSTGKLFGAGATGAGTANAGAGTGGGPLNLFGSAISNNQTGNTGTSFFGNAMPQNTNAPLSFGNSGGASGGAGGGMNMMGSVRKTKQI